MTDILTLRLADRLKKLRKDSGWSLDRLAQQSGVSRATLSRLENAEVSPTTEVLGKLCTTWGLTLSRLMALVEDSFEAVVRREDQPQWQDEKAGFTRISVSPPAGQLAAEMLSCELKPGANITYDAPPVPGLEHHLVLQSGYLEVEIEGVLHKLNEGDCLRYQLRGSSVFRTQKSKSARYILVQV